MVQYCIRSQRDVHRDYWKLPSKADLLDQAGLLDEPDMMREAGFVGRNRSDSEYDSEEEDGLEDPEQPDDTQPEEQDSSALPYSQTITELSRRACGVLEYAGCEREELANFCEARGIALGSEEDKEGIVRLLHHADESASFRLPDLPPELRVRIYEVYFETFSEAVEAPAQPPITQVSKLLRRESLPVFYKSKTFVLSLNSYEWWESGLELYTCDTDIDQKRFWEELPKQYLQFIRKLRFDDYQSDIHVSHFISLDQDRGNTTLEFMVKDEENPVARDCCIRHSKRLQLMVDRMTARPGGKTLQRDDIAEFIRRFELDGPDGGYVEDEDYADW